MAKKCRHIGRDFRATTTADADLWKTISVYLNEWRDNTTILWVKAHETQNKKADEDADGAYQHHGTSLYREGYCSQFDSIWGAMIGGEIVTHKMGATVIWHLQKTQYLRYWGARRKAGAWTENSDIDGHAAACRWARKGNPKGLPCAHYKEMNNRHLTFDFKHQRNTHDGASILETEQYWPREAIGRWMSVCEDKVAENARRTLSEADVRGIGTRLAGTRPVDAKAIQDLALRLGAQQTGYQWKHIEASIRRPTQLSPL